MILGVGMKPGLPSQAGQKQHTQGIIWEGLEELPHFPVEFPYQSLHLTLLQRGEGTLSPEQENGSTWSP